MPSRLARTLRRARASTIAAAAIVCLGLASAVAATAARNAAKSPGDAIGILPSAGLPAAGFPTAADPWVQVVSQNETGCELLFTAPEPETAAEGVRIPGFGTRGEPGLPLIYERAASVAVPGPAGARLEIFDVRERDLGRVAREIAPAPVGFEARRVAGEAGKAIAEWEAVPARRLEGDWPAEAVLLGGVARLRGRDFVTVHFQPLRYRADGGVTFVRSARVRVTFAERGRAGTGLAALESDPLHAALVNAASASQWAPGVAPASAAKPPGAKHTAVLPPLRLRIRIGQRGIYQLSYSSLLAAGVPVANNAIDPRTFRLFFDNWKPVVLAPDSTPASWQSDWEMHEAAIWIPGEANGTFSSDDPEDRIVFYALGPEGYDDLAGTTADSLAYTRHAYDKNQYAWLVWGGAFGRRMSVQDVAVTDTLAAPRVDRVWHREHREQDATYAPIDDLWYWEEVRPTRPVRRQIPLDLAGADSTTGFMRLKLGYFEATGLHVLDVRLNNLLLQPRVTFSQVGSFARVFDFPGVSLRQRISGVDVNNVLDLAAVQGLHTALGTCLLEADFTYTRRLVAPTSRFLGWSARPATSPTEIYRLAGFGAKGPTLVDATDPLDPVRLTGLTPTGAGATTVWSALHGRGTGKRAHYLAADITPVPTPDLRLRNIASLRSRASAPDMLIVTHESLRAAADRLAAHRRAHWPEPGTPDILVVNTADIYDEFSGGRLDPLAIRNYAKFLYALDATPRMKYLLLFGDATYDTRQLLGSSPPTLVPTTQPGYYDPRFNRFQDTYAVDDWLGEFDTPHNGFPTPFPVPELAIGRLAARSPSEAERLVDKLIGYETMSGFGPWRARILMSADDECTPRGCGETFHIDNTETLCRQVPRDLDIVRFYLTEYPATLGQKPQARSAFIRSWSEGCTVVNYQGHGAPRQLADEVLLLSTDIPSLVNGLKLPVFLPLSCTVSEFDDPGRQSMCEDLIASTAGGAIATIGATTPTYVTANAALNSRIFEELFKNGATSHVPLGIVHQISKVRAVSELNETYILLGDPALALVLPHALVRITSGADTLSTGERAQVHGRVVSPVDSTLLAGFDGQVEVEVRGTDDTSGYHSPQVTIRYDLPGTPLYRGSVPVVDGEFGFQFIVPVGATPGVKGRMKAYAADPTTDAHGTRSDIRIVVGDNPVTSVGAPRIAMRFPNDRTRVKAGTLLTAEIRDENGINIQGTSLRNSIYLDFDHSNNPLDVTGQFRYTAGSDSAGSVAVPIPGDLTPGAHTATLIASDNLQNTATATLDFQVVDEAVVQLVNVLAFPNPFKDWTRFFFEITDPAAIELQVFSTSGRQVWSHREHIETGTQGSIKWDGVDAGEDILANGTYLFRLRARPDRPGSPELEHIGKVVIMR